MSFNQIVNTVPSATTFNSAGTGRYVDSTVVFGGPQNYFLLSPARKTKPVSGGDAAYVCGVTRYIEVDTTSNGVVKRLGGRVRTIIELDDGFPLSGIDAAQRQTDEFITVTNLNRMLNGEV